MTSYLFSTSMKYYHCTSDIENYTSIRYIDILLVDKNKILWLAYLAPDDNVLHSSILQHFCVKGSDLLY